MILAELIEKKIGKMAYVSTSGLSFIFCDTFAIVASCFNLMDKFVATCEIFRQVVMRDYAVSKNH
jgi:hypothetical protein